MHGGTSGVNPHSDVLAQGMQSPTGSQSPAAGNPPKVLSHHTAFSLMNTCELTTLIRPMPKARVQLAKRNRATDATQLLSNEPCPISRCAQSRCFLKSRSLRPYLPEDEMEETNNVWELWTDNKSLRYHDNNNTVIDRLPCIKQLRSESIPLLNRNSI